MIVFLTYRLHRPSGQAIVTLDGKDHYLGLHGSEASRLQYDRLIAEWLAHGRHLPLPAEVQPAVSVNQVILAFWEHAQDYYRKPGRHADQRGGQFPPGDPAAALLLRHDTGRGLRPARRQSTP